MRTRTLRSSLAWSMPLSAFLRPLPLFPPLPPLPLLSASVGAQRLRVRAGLRVSEGHARSVAQYVRRQHGAQLQHWRCRAGAKGTAAYAAVI
jgi:hypothetical protein